MAPETTTLTKKDFASDQEVRWCPGCGDYAILSAVQTVFADLGVPRERFVMVSGIGCSSRFPYYMNTYGFHTIHGRAPAIASGLKLTRPDLDVWVVTGDGDALSIGGNHFMHILRRNIGVKVLLFNNRIYGLTKGQYSPTSHVGTRTKSTPVGSIDAPFNPLAVALGAGATFVARSVDIFQPHLRSILKRAWEHRGTAFVEIYQNCPIFNDRTFAHVTDKEARNENVLYLEHDKPMVFGKDGSRGLRHNGNNFEVVELGDEGAAVDDCMAWDEARSSPGMAFETAHFEHPEFPVPIGVFRSVEQPVYEESVQDQIRQQTEDKGEGTLEDLLHSGSIWTVGEDGQIS